MPRVVFWTGEMLFGCPGSFFGRGKCFLDAQGRILDGGNAFWMPRVVFGTGVGFLDAKGSFLGRGESFFLYQRVLLEDWGTLMATGPDL